MAHLPGFLQRFHLLDQVRAEYNAATDVEKASCFPPHTPSLKRLHSILCCWMQHDGDTMWITSHDVKGWSVRVDLDTGDVTFSQTEE